MIAPGIHLPAPWAQTVLELVDRFAPGASIWAYGSRVGSHSHPGSDLDVVLLAPHGQAIRAAQIAALREALRESTLPIVVDIHDWSRVPEHFRKEIESNHYVMR